MNTDRARDLKMRWAVEGGTVREGAEAPASPVGEGNVGWGRAFPGCATLFARFWR